MFLKLIVFNLVDTTSIMQRQNMQPSQSAPDMQWQNILPPQLASMPLLQALKFLNPWTPSQAQDQLPNIQEQVQWQWYNQALHEMMRYYTRNSVPNESIKQQTRIDESELLQEDEFPDEEIYVVDQLSEDETARSHQRVEDRTSNRNSDTSRDRTKLKSTELTKNVNRKNEHSLSGENAKKKSCNQTLQRSNDRNGNLSRQRAAGSQEINVGKSQRYQQQLNDDKESSPDLVCEKSPDKLEKKRNYRDRSPHKLEEKRNYRNPSSDRSGQQLRKRGGEHSRSSSPKPRPWLTKKQVDRKKKVNTSIES